MPVEHLHSRAITDKTVECLRRLMYILLGYQVIISVALQRAMSITELRYLSKLRSEQRRDVPVLEALWEIHDTPTVEQDVGVLPFPVVDVQHGRCAGRGIAGR